MILTYFIPIVFITVIMGLYFFYKTARRRRSVFEERHENRMDLLTRRQELLGRLNKQPEGRSSNNNETAYNQE